MKQPKRQIPPARLAAKPIPLRRKLLYSLIAQVLILGAAESFVRVVLGPAPRGDATVGTRKFVTWLSELSTGQEQHAPLYKEEPELMWRLAPNTQIETINHHRADFGEKQAIRITINEDGYRGRKADVGTEGKVFRVLCLGDSNFFGYPLDDAQAFPRVLEDVLKRQESRTHWEVVNGGVPGYTTIQGRLWYSRMFARQRQDVLLLSFLNNDAWLQPRSDRESLRWYGSARYPVSIFIHHSQLVCWAERWIFGSSAKTGGVPRVSLEEFAHNYESFIDEARQNKTRVIILDYRAYRQYEPYSQRLRELAARKSVDYISVAELIEQELKERACLAKYPQLAERVQRRWGPVLNERPYLWYFAEYYPEHLNEVGVTLLAERLAPLIKGDSEASK